MKRKLLISKSLAMGLVALLLLAFCPGRARAAQAISGTWYVSYLTSNEIVLTGATTLIVDCSKKLKQIAGVTHSLDIVFQSADYTLTVEHSGEETALQASNLNVVGPGRLVATSRCRAIICENATFTNVYVKAKGRNDEPDGGFSSYSKGLVVYYSLNINNSEVYATGRRSGIDLGVDRWAEMTITGENSKVTAEGRGQNSAYGCYGRGIASDHGYDIHLKVEGGELNVQSHLLAGIKCARLEITGGKVTVNSDIYNDWNDVNFDDDFAAIECNCFQMSGGELKASSNFDGISINHTSWYGLNGYRCEVSGGKLTAYGGKNYYGIRYSCPYQYRDDENMGLHFTGEDTQVDASGGQCGIFCTTPGERAVDGNSYLYIDRAKVNAKSRGYGENEYQFKYYGIWAGKIIITQGNNPITAIGKNESPFFGYRGHIIMRRPFVLNGEYQQQYATSDAGVDVGAAFRLNGSYIKGKATLTKPSINGLGYYYFTGLSKAGNEMVLTIPQEIINYVNCIDAVKTIDWYRSDDETTIGDYLASGDTYTVRTVDLGKYIYAKLSFDTHTGSLRSNAVRVSKTPNTATPVKPTLAYSTSSDKIAVTNAKSNQEYLVLTSEVKDNDITEAQWATAEQGTSSTYLLLNGGTKGKLNYVYTRFTETASQDAGQIIRHSSVYYGSASGMTDFTLTATTTSGSALQQDANGAYNVAYNSVAKLTVAPVPSSVSWQGVTGENWLINMDTSGGTMYDSDMGYLYTDAACTNPIVVDGEHYYKTVYYKFVNNSHNGLTGMLIDAIAPVGSTTVDHWLTFNVSNSSGTWNIMNIAPSLFQVERGSVITVPYTTNPGVATCNTLTAEAVANTWGGTAPTLTFNPSANTVTIDATNSVANSNYYRYDLYADGKKLSLRKGVEVLPATVKGVVLNPHQVVLDPGTTLQLTATVLPSCAADDATVTWSVDDSSHATISSSGLVTVNSSQDCLGEEVLAIATSGGYSDTCRIQITGEKYPLWVKGTQVNSENQDDVLGDGKVSYEAGKLSLNGANLQLSTNKKSLESEIPGLIINVKGINTMSSAADAVYFRESARLTGNGEFRVTSTGSSGLTCALGGFQDLAVEDTVQVRAVNNSSNGMGSWIMGNLSVDSPTAQFRANGKWFSLLFGNLNGSITEPEGGYVQYYDGLGTSTVYDASGNYVHNAWVTVTGEVEPEGVLGDVTGDGLVDVEDVNAAINIILKTKTVDDYPGNADVNGDSMIDVEDVNRIINIILKLD